MKTANSVVDYDISIATQPVRCGDGGRIAHDNKIRRNQKGQQSAQLDQIGGFLADNGEGCHRNQASYEKNYKIFPS